MTPQSISSGRLPHSRVGEFSNVVIEYYEKMVRSSPQLTNRLILGDDAPERQRNSQRNLVEGRTIYWMITAERPRL